MCRKETVVFLHVGPLRFLFFADTRSLSPTRLAPLHARLSLTSRHPPISTIPLPKAHDGSTGAANNIVTISLPALTCPVTVATIAARQESPKTLTSSALLNNAL